MTPKDAKLVRCWYKTNQWVLILPLVFDEQLPSVVVTETKSDVDMCFDPGVFVFLKDQASLSTYPPCLISHQTSSSATSHVSGDVSGQKTTIRSHLW